MSEHRIVLARVRGALFSRRRRWVTGGIAALGVSSLILSGLASPASALDLPSSVTLEQWADVGSTWVTGSLGLNGAGASTYEEGQTVPFHLDVTSAGAGTFDFSVCRDYQDGDIFGYLHLEPYDTSFNGVTSLLAGSLTDAADGPDQPFTGAAVVGSVHIDSVDEVGGQGGCGAGQRETEVQITIAGGLGGAVVGASVLWGGHLASPADPGVGGNHGAGQFPGASLSMRLGGSAKNVGIKPDAIIQLGTITVQKVVDLGTASASQFCFTINPDPHGVGAQCPASGQSTVAFVGLPTDNYQIAEVGLPGYTFASGSGSTENCGFVGAVATGSVTAANDPINATCVFHNRRVGGTLTVNQVIDPGDDPGRFNLEIDGSTAGTGANVGNGGTTGAVNVTSGAHAVGQSAGTGTDLDDYAASTSCTVNGTAVVLSGDEVSVADGQDVVCTITLTREPTPTPDPDPVIDPTPDPDPTPTPDPDPVIDPTPDPDPTPTPDPDPVIDPTPDPDPTPTPDPDPVIDPTPDPTPTPDPDPVIDPTPGPTPTPDPDPIVTPDPDPTVDPNTDPGTEPDRCASSRGRPNCDDDEPIVGPEVQGEVVSTTTTTAAAPVADPGGTVAGGGDNVALPAPVDPALAGEADRTAPDPAPAGGFLPRTGSGIGFEVTLAFGLLGAGITILRLSRRRSPAGQSQG